MAGLLGRWLPGVTIGQRNVVDEGRFEDNEKFYFGTDSDFSVYFNGTVLLFEGASGTVGIDSRGVITSQNGLTVTAGTLSLYVNPSTGNNSNNGLTAGSPKLTIQGAIDAIPRMCPGAVTINLADGTYSNTQIDVPLIQATQPDSTFASVFLGFQGNDTTPSNVVWDAGSTAAGNFCLDIRNTPNMIVRVSGIKFTNAEKAINVNHGRLAINKIEADNISGRIFDVANSSTINFLSGGSTTVAGTGAAGSSLIGIFTFTLWFLQHTITATGLGNTGATIGNKSFLSRVTGGNVSITKSGGAPATETESRGFDVEGGFLWSNSGGTVTVDNFGTGLRNTKEALYGVTTSNTFTINNCLLGWSFTEDALYNEISGASTYNYTGVTTNVKITPPATVLSSTGLNSTPTLVAPSSGDSFGYDQRFGRLATANTWTAVNTFNTTVNANTILQVSGLEAMRNVSTVLAINYANEFLGVSIGQKAGTSGAPLGLAYTAAAHTGITSLTELKDININLARTLTWTGAGGTLDNGLINIDGTVTYAFANATNVNDTTYTLICGGRNGALSTIVDSIGFAVETAVGFSGTTNNALYEIGALEILNGIGTVATVAGLITLAGSNSLGNQTATLTNLNEIRIEQQTYTSTTNTRTVTNPESLYITAPVAGTNVTFSNTALAIRSPDLCQFDAGVRFASSGQSTISNYTENTFSPTVTLVGGAGNTVPVYSTNTGRHTRIGRTVYVDVYLTGDGGNEGAGTGTVNIALPITASASNPTSFFPCGYAENGATNDEIWGQIGASGTTIELSYFSAIQTRSALTGADQNNTTRTIRLKFSYEV